MITDTFRRTRRGFYMCQPRALAQYVRDGASATRELTRSSARNSRTGVGGEGKPGARVCECASVCSAPFKYIGSDAHAYVRVCVNLKGGVVASLHERAGWYIRPTMSH